MSLASIASRTESRSTAKIFMGYLTRSAAVVARPAAADLAHAAGAALVPAGLGHLDGLHKQVFQGLPLLDQVPQRQALVPQQVDDGVDRLALGQDHLPEQLVAV